MHRTDNDIGAGRNIGSVQVEILVKKILHNMKPTYCILNPQNI